MNKHFFVFVLVGSLFFSLSAYALETKQKGQEYPTGIASIKLGDSSEIVYDKILKSAHIVTKYTNYKDWYISNFSSLFDMRNRKRGHDQIELFGKKFKMRLGWSLPDQLYSIDMAAFISEETFWGSEKNKVKEFGKLVVEQYSMKYGRPSQLNLDSYPSTSRIKGSMVVMSRWNFPNNVIVTMFVQNPVPFLDFSKRTKKIYFVIRIEDKEESDKLKAYIREKKEKKENQEKKDRGRKHKKSRDLF